MPHRFGPVPLSIHLPPPPPPHPKFGFFVKKKILLPGKGWFGGVMVLGKLPVPGHPTIWITVGQGPTALAVGVGRGYFDIFTLIYPFFSSFSLPWEAARYRLKYCLKGPLNSKPPPEKNFFFSFRFAFLINNFFFYLDFLLKKNHLL